jgi:ferredoxin
MNTRTIDAAKCIGCGKCVQDCINQYLILAEDESGHKKASFKERGRCLECGHCNAICPQRAISGGKSLFECDEEDQLLTLMAKKRTVRHYVKNSQIDSEIIEKIVMAGQTAPTDRNRKSARMLLIKEMLPKVYNRALDYLVEEVQKTGTINPLYVPTMNLDSNREEVLWNAEYLVAFIGLPASSIDASIASERMQLEAEKYGIGTAYRGDMKTAINNVEELREWLGVKKNEEVLITFAMGKTNLKYLCPAIKQNRKVEYL